MENHTNVARVLEKDEELAEAIALDGPRTSGKVLFQEPRERDGVYFIHNDELRDQILEGNHTGVLPDPDGHDVPNETRH